MLDVAVATRNELGRRSRNEDMLCVAHGSGPWLVVLADGAGGHQGGAEAARLAVTQLEAALHQAAPGFDPATLNQAVLAAHAGVQSGQADATGLGRMHTTVVVLWIDPLQRAALWSHVGDSRLYRARRGRLLQLTSDDSVVQRMLDARLITPLQAETHPRKNQLIAALGIEDEIDPHTVPQPVAVEDGDAFLLCSDGWWSVLDERTILDALRAAATVDEWLRLMQWHIEQRALPRQDNFSAIGVWIRDPDEDTQPRRAAQAQG